MLLGPGPQVVSSKCSCAAPDLILIWTGTGRTEPHLSSDKQGPNGALQPRLGSMRTASGSCGAAELSHCPRPPHVHHTSTQTPHGSPPTHTTRIDQIVYGIPSAGGGQSKSGSAGQHSSVVSPPPCRRLTWPAMYIFPFSLGLRCKSWHRPNRVWSRGCVDRPSYPAPIRPQLNKPHDTRFLLRKHTLNW